MIVLGGYAMPLIKHTPHKSSLGLQANVVISIIWFGGFVISLIEPIAMFAFAVPFVILFLEKDSNLVRSHAIQAVSLYIINIILSILMTVIPVLVFLFFILAIVELALIVVAAFKGWYYHEYELPLIQPLAKWVSSVFLRV
jgi:uncharacterized membrane protein